MKIKSFFQVWKSKLQKNKLCENCLRKALSKISKIVNKITTTQYIKKWRSLFFYLAISTFALVDISTDTKKRNISSQVAYWEKNVEKYLFLLEDLNQQQQFDEKHIRDKYHFVSHADEVVYVVVHHDDYGEL